MKEKQIEETIQHLIKESEKKHQYKSHKTEGPIPQLHKYYFKWQEASEEKIYEKNEKTLFATKEVDKKALKDLGSQMSASQI